MWTPRGADWTVLDQNATSCLAKKKNCFGLVFKSEYKYIAQHTALNIMLTVIAATVQVQRVILCSVLPYYLSTTPKLVAGKTTSFIHGLPIQTRLRN
jgi:hypothetical protein